ncbi:MAG: fasciclin domain-containing protein, partial [Brevundimonas mediterranea]
MTNIRTLMLVAVSGGALMALGACNNNETTTPADSTAMAPAEGAAMAPMAADPMVGGAAMSPNETIVA